MRRIIALLIATSGPATAWTYSATPICTLDRTNAQADLRITYDPGLGEYHLMLEDLADGIERPNVFSITFDGPRGMTITTDRHTVTDGALHVRDRGFGNVLNGLEFNQRAIARVGPNTYTFDLSEAPPAVQAFRACEVAPSV